MILIDVTLAEEKDRGRLEEDQGRRGGDLDHLVSGIDLGQETGPEGLQGAMNVVEVIEAVIVEAAVVIGGQPVAEVEEEKLRNQKTSEQFSFETCHTPSTKSQ